MNGPKRHLWRRQQLITKHMSNDYQVVGIEATKKVNKPTGEYLHLVPSYIKYKPVSQADFTLHLAWSCNSASRKPHRRRRRNSGTAAWPKSESVKYDIIKAGADWKCL